MQPTAASIPALPRYLTIPGAQQPLDLHLPADLAALREAALAFHTRIGTDMPPIPELLLSDAAAWQLHTPGEHWLIWRARMVAARLAAMPVELDGGEQIVGRPRFRRPSEAEGPALEAARAALASMPSFPGGDAGHLHPDFDKLFAVGLDGIRAEVAERASTAADNAEKAAFYAACRIALDGMSAYIVKVAEACSAQAVDMSETSLRWLEMAAICRHVSGAAPRTFHEAIELLFLTIVALWQGEGHYLTSPGRLDRTLRPFYEADLAAGRITRQAAFELICQLYINVNRIMSTGLALAVLVGGRDGEGRDITNDLTYICLAARIATGLGYPTVGLCWHRGTPSELMDFAVALLGAGRGDPAFFNDEEISAGLMEHGVTFADAVNYMNSTCVEIKPVAASNVWVATPYFNLPGALNTVIDAVAGGAEPEPATYDELEARVQVNLRDQIAQAAADMDRIWQARTVYGGFPLVSCFTNDCLARGLDYDRGGARYNWVENSLVGLANLTDSLLAVRNLVYETQEFTLAELGAILAADFAGHEPLRQRILNRLPKYGNDNEASDAIAQRWAEWLMATTASNTIGPHSYVPGFFCWIMHERMGAQTGATPDGRRAGWPLADGAGAAQGRERRGPTASVLSTTCWSHRPALGGLVHNAKFSANLFKSEADRAAMRQLIETYLGRGGFEMQVNVVSRDTLLAARAHPEQYQDLLVRVAGYSDYFVKLTPEMQEEVIARTEHEL